MLQYDFSRTRIQSAGAFRHLLLILIVSLVISAPVVLASNSGQDFDKFNRFVQASTAGDSAASRLFLEGRTLIASSKWSEAAKKFDKIIRDYPRSENVDVALYWHAYALANQKEFAQADRSLERLIREYPQSSWVSDALVKRLELAAHLGRAGEEPPVDSRDEIRIAALQSLFHADPARAVARAREILRRDSASSPRLKEYAVELLGQYGGKDATPILVEVARSERDPKMRKRAIYALGWRSDDSIASMLKEIVTASDDNEMAKAALSALASNAEQGEKSYEFFVQIAKSGKTVELRRQAISALFRFGEDRVIDELVAIYRANDDVEIKRSVIATLGSGGFYYTSLFTAYSANIGIGYGEGRGIATTVTPRADVPAVVAPVEPRQSVTPAPPAPRGLPPGLGIARPSVNSSSSSVKQERAAAALVQLFDAERDENLKASIISALGRTGQKQATKKLMEIARSDSSVTLKKRAISALSMSRDPEVLTLLEELIK